MYTSKFEKNANVVFTNKKSQAKVSTVHTCIFLLLVAGHNYLHYELSKYTAIHVAHGGESILH